MNHIEKKIREATAGKIVSPYDGKARSQKEEERINGLCRRLLSTKDGENLVDYLRSISTNVVMPATASDAELRDREGMRRLVGILVARANSAPAKTPQGE